jgi:hypothetical protein
MPAHFRAINAASSVSGQQISTSILHIHSRILHLKLGWSIQNSSKTLCGLHNLKLSDATTADFQIERQLVRPIRTPALILESATIGNRI